MSSSLLSLGVDFLAAFAALGLFAAALFSRVLGRLRPVGPVKGGWALVTAGLALLAAGRFLALAPGATDGSYLLASARLLADVVGFPLLVFGAWRGLGRRMESGLVGSGLGGDASRRSGGLFPAGGGTPDRSVAGWDQVETERDRLLFALDQHAIVTITDAGGRITYVNSRFEKISQFRREELLGQDHRLVKSDRHSQAFFAEMWGTILAGKVWRGEVCNRRRDGGLYWQQTTIVPFLDARGRPYQFIAIRTDISRAKALEETLKTQQEGLAAEVASRTRELEEARDAALRASQAKSLFLADMSHEIRGPLNVVLGLLELLRNAPLDAQFRELLQLSRSSGQAVLSLLNDTLDFSKIEAGQLTLDQDDFDLRELVDESAFMMAPLAHAKGVELTAFIPRGMNMMVRGDRNRLRQVFVNLLGNAIKFTPRGGWVELHGGIVSREADGAEFHFEVWDTGVGVPEAQRERIFAKFAQIEHALASGVGEGGREGTGLGLTISRRLVELMGGRIGVVDNASVSSGSIFHFSVILEERSLPRMDPQPLALPGLRVLLVASHGLQRVMLDDFFRCRGIPLDHAKDLDQAMDRLEQAREEDNPFTLLVINRGAGRSAPAALDALAAGLVPETAVILLTDLLDYGWDEAAPLPGAVLCLQKPISADRLRGAILRLLGDEKAESSTGEARPEGGSDRVDSRVNYPQRILLVDDQEANLKVARGMLQTLGCDAARIDVTVDGEGAVAAFEQQPYDFVLMDCRMPGMGGLAAVERIRQQEAATGRPRAPIIALTADITESGRQACLTAGMNEVVIKPVTLCAMEGLLARHLQPGPPVELASDEAVVDIPRAMGAFGLPEDTFREVAALVVEQIPELLASMGRDIEARSQEEGRAKAHVLRGSMANAIFPVLKEPSQQLHREIRASRWEAAEEALGALEKAFAPILEGLRRYLAG